MSLALHNSFVTVAGTEIFHAETGTGRPLVLLHGLSDTHRTWRKVLPALAKDHRVLLPDLPGCGLSGRPDESYSLAWQAEVMGAWLARMNLEQVDLVGHSYGGGVAQFMLLSQRARIRRIALIASGGLGREVSFELRLASLARFIEQFGQPLMGRGTSLALRAVGAVLDPEDAEWMRETNALPGSARAFARTVRDVIDWRGQRRHFLDHVEEVADLPPMALFWGERDRVIPCKHAFESTKLLANVPVSTFAGVGHFPHQQVPAALSRAILDFLDAERVEPARFLKVEPRRLLRSRVRVTRARSAAA
jgi:pimeloyl-ACP methyl ester carboxylesterase